MLENEASEIKVVYSATIFWDVTQRSQKAAAEETKLKGTNFNVVNLFSPRVTRVPPEQTEWTALLDLE